MFQSLKSNLISLAVLLLMPVAVFAEPHLVNFNTYTNGSFNEIPIFQPNPSSNRVPRNTLVQVIKVGPNGVIDRPSTGGGAGGDDIYSQQFYMGVGVEGDGLFSADILMWDQVDYNPDPSTWYMIIFNQGFYLRLWPTIPHPRNTQTNPIPNGTLYCESQIYTCTSDEQIWNVQFRLSSARPCYMPLYTQLTLQGTLQYTHWDDCNGTNPAPRPVKNAAIAIRNSQTGTDIISTITGSDGGYTFPSASISSLFESYGTLTIRVNCDFHNATNNYEVCRIRNSPNAVPSIGSLVYAYQNQLPTITLQGNNVGALAIADAIRRGYDFAITQTQSNPITIPRCDVFWEYGLAQTTGVLTTPPHNMYINGDAVPNDQYGPDQWDEDLVLHEYGHFLGHTLGIYPPNAVLQHWWDMNAIENPTTGACNELAWNEGWATYFSSAVRSNRFYSDVGVRQVGLLYDRLLQDLEDGTQVQTNNGNQTTTYANDLGLTCEGTVASLLWDLHDASPTDDDDRSQTRFNAQNQRVTTNPDGVSDHFSNPPRHWDVVRNHTVSSHGCYSALDLWNGWNSRHPDNKGPLWSNYWEHGVRNLSAPSPLNVSSLGTRSFQPPTYARIVLWNPIYFAINGMTYWKIYRNTTNNFSTAVQLTAGMNTHNVFEFPLFYRIYCYAGWYADVTALENQTYYYWVQACTDAQGSNPSLSAPETSTFEGAYLITEQLELKPETYSVKAGTRFLFSGNGKLIIPNGATLELIGGDNPNDQVYLHSDSLTLAGSKIEVQSGGQVIGKHAKFENLPKAIKVSGGTVDVDSMEFVNCDSALQMISGTALLSNTKFEKCDVGIQQSNGQVELNDALFDSCGKGIDYQDAQSSATLKVYDSRFLNGTTGINAASNIGTMKLSGCVFDSQFVQSVKIYKSENVSIDQCDFNGLHRFESPYTYGLYVERCSTNVRISNCDVSGYNTGTNVVLSNINLDTCDFVGNSYYGVSWSNNHPTATLRGRIHSCTFSNNCGLSPDWAAGFYAYACSPQVTCCTFDEQQSHGALLEGNPTPWFYNKYDESVHANIFNNYCTTYGYPSVSLLDNAAPVFGYNRNNFYPTDDADVVMVDFSPNVLKHYVQENHYDFPSITIDNFYPNDTTYWQYSPGSAVGNCYGDTITSGVGGMEMLVQGDEYAELGNNTAALESYQAALIASGEETEIAAAAIAAISEIDPTAVSVGTELERTAQYCATYTYDALGDFTTSDAIRETILSEGDALDSGRVEYDLAVSELLRPSTMAVGPRAEAARERAIQHREAAMLKLQKARGKLSFAKTQSQPQQVLPLQCALHPVYPNPFNVITNVRFDLPEANHVRVSVYDATGRLVTNLVDGNQNAGYHNVQWNGTINSSGVYFVTIHTNKYTATRKAVLLK